MVQAQLTEKKYKFDNFFEASAFYRGGPMVYFKENYNFIRFQRGSARSRVCGVQMLNSIET